jgi:GNAT superfamily N-acetyltransferase
MFAAIDVTHEPEQMPAPAEVERLLAVASSRLGPGEAAMLARASARMYSWARSIPGAATVSAHDGGELVGFGYGYSWNWAAMTDAWSVRLRDELGASAAIIDDSFAVVLLVVAPQHRRGGLGGALLSSLSSQADEALTWLQTDADSPLRALCAALDWRVLEVASDLIMISG